MARNSLFLQPVYNMPINLGDIDPIAKPEATDIGSVDERGPQEAPAPVLSDAARAMLAHSPMLQTGNIYDDLRALRAALPFVPIMQFPLVTRNVVVDAVTPKEIPFPDGSILMRLSSNNNFFASSTGQAKVPLSTDDISADNGTLNPTGVWFYCGGKRSISVIGTQPNTIVSAAFFAQL